MDNRNEKGVRDLFAYMIEVLRDAKPNDRSERDRYWAITITEVEKARAVFEMYAIERNEGE